MWLSPSYANNYLPRAGSWNTETQILKLKYWNHELANLRYFSRLRPQKPYFILMISNDNENHKTQYQVINGHCTISIKKYPVYFLPKLIYIVFSVIKY